MTMRLTFAPVGGGALQDWIGAHAGGHRTAGRSLAYPHVDILWRLTTRRWARARTAVARFPAARVCEVVESAVLLASMVGMSAAGALAAVQM